MTRSTELSLAEMTDDELMAFYRACEGAALAWLRPRALPTAGVTGIDAQSISDAWQAKAKRARAEIERRGSIAREAS